LLTAATRPQKFPLENPFQPLGNIRIKALFTGGAKYVADFISAEPEEMTSLQNSLASNPQQLYRIRSGDDLFSSNSVVSLVCDIYRYRYIL
jgi:hypothetical protein